MPPERHRLVLVLWLLNTVLEQLDATTQLRLDETREIMPAFGWLNCFKLEEFPRLDETVLCKFGFTVSPRNLVWVSTACDKPFFDDQPESEPVSQFVPTDPQ